MTAVRIVDHITISIPTDAPADVPSEGHALLAHIEGLIAFKKGYSARRHVIRLFMSAPSGKGREIYKDNADFKNETHGGYTLRLKTGLAVTERGLYWLDVILDGRQMTRMPLLISVNRVDPNEPPIKKTTKS